MNPDHWEQGVKQSVLFYSSLGIFLHVVLLAVDSPEHALRDEQPRQHM